MGTQRRVGGRCLLPDHHPLVRAVGADGHLRAQRVDLRGLQPLGGELAQLPAGGRLQLGQQVVEGGVAPGVLAEVGAQAGQERLLAHVRDELLEHARALGVRDAVEVDLDGLQVRHLAVDRVGGGELVLPVTPVLADRQERGPRVVEPGGVRVAPVAGPLGERLVQPQVVPPAHGDQVTEPHVRQLVQDRVGALLVLEVGDLRPEDVVRLGVRDAAEVLHRAGVEVRHPELVVLGQRVTHAELLLEEVEALRGDQVQVVGVHVRGHAGPAEVAHVDAVVGAAHLVVRAGAQRGDVGAHPLRDGEVHRLQALTGGLLALHRHVRHDPPVVRDGGVPGVDALQVGLVEAGVYLLRVGGLELAVEVGLAVHRVDGAVQALPAVGVAEVGVDHQHVLGGQAAERQSLLGGPAGQVHRLAVERGRPHRFGGCLDECGRPRLGTAEPDLGHRAERATGGLHRGRQVKADVVPGHLEQAGPLGRLDLGQVAHSRHCSSPSHSSRRAPRRRFSPGRS